VESINQKTRTKMLEGYPLVLEITSPVDISNLDCKLRLQTPDLPLIIYLYSGCICGIAGWIRGMRGISRPGHLGRTEMLDFCVIGRVLFV
jgi:hypothetical protein